MINIIKGETPARFIEIERDFGCYSATNASERAEILDSLLCEQGFLCAYCMRRIGIGDATIEHFFPQNPPNNLTLSYTNLYAVCDGNEKISEGAKKGRSRLTCDKKRGNQTIRFSLSNIEDYVSYDSNGYINSASFDLEVQQILNLNEQNILLPNRKAALNEFQRVFHKKFQDCNQEKLTKIYKNMRQSSEKLEFLGIFLWYIETRINKMN